MPNGFCLVSPAAANRLSPALGIIVSLSIGVTRNYPLTHEWEISQYRVILNPCYPKPIGSRPDIFSRFVGSQCLTMT